MRLVVVAFVALFIACSDDALAHGGGEHESSAMPEKASSQTSDKKPDVNQERESADAYDEHGEHDAHDDKDGHHDKLGGGSGESATTHQHSDGENDHKKMEIEAAMQKAAEAVAVLKYRATAMMFGFVALIAGLAAGYPSGRRKLDAS